jgi:uncharacterized Ntn-hydrolase superfamily protein
MTLSIVARCNRTGMLGVAVCSSSPAVAARCAHARPGVGAAATQNFTDPSLGRRGLDLIEHGATAGTAIDILSSTASDPAFRQLLAIAPAGQPAAFTGLSCLPRTAEAFADDAAAAGNLLASVEVPAAMLSAFSGSEGHLAARLVRALRAGLDAGGETDQVHSAGMIVVHDLPWAVVDLRIDWTEECPAAALEALWKVWEPRMPIYRARALQPASAPQTDLPTSLPPSP